MIIRGETRDVQVGAFLMLLRVKEETGDELAGFVEACREEMIQPTGEIQAELDWSSYAGKKHQHPWFILSILLLAEAGHRVFLHGADGHTPGRLYTEKALKELGLPVAADWQQVGRQLDSGSFSYLPLRRFCQPLHDLIQLRPLLGLRSPVNTLTRMLNPLRAPCSIQSIFHPAYATLHQQADRLLAQPRALVFKGDSGEVEVKPQADTRLYRLLGDTSSEQVLPRTLNARVQTVVSPSAKPLRELWRGSCDNEYGDLAVQSTAALALTLLQPDIDYPQASQLALRMWKDRDKQRLD
jgi:anthranilate phosphoribosyltransferase